MTVPPELYVDLDAADTDAVLVWRFDTPHAVLSSAPVGGGWRSTTSMLNIGVADGYRRIDLDVHVAEVAAAVDVAAPVTMLTAADVRRFVASVDGDVVVHATVGVTKPTWAADADGAFHRRRNGAWVVEESFGAPATAEPARSAGGPGTINVVVQVPVALTPAAATNAVMTATEAKAQALFDAGVPGTGTASDAITICWPGPERSGSGHGRSQECFAGPRSPWGARIARAVHAAVTEGWRMHP